MLIISGFIIIGKVAGALKEVSIAYKYGISETIDQYIFVGTWVNLIPAIWVSVLTAAFVPIARRMSPGELSRFSSQVTGVVILVGLFSTILLYFGLPVLIDNLPFAFSTRTDPELLLWIHWLVPLCGGGVLVGLFSAQLLVHEHHANTLAEGIPALTIAAVLLLWPIGPVTHSLVVGSLLGVTFHLLFLYYLLHVHQLSVKPTVSLESPAWIGFKKALSLLVVGKIITSFVAPIDQAVASSIGEGSISTLNYANKLTALLIGIGVTAIGRAVLPVLSESKYGVYETVRVAKIWSFVLLLLGFLFLFFGWILGEHIVRFVFERGEFGSAETERVTEVFRYALIQLPFFFASIVLVQLFASCRLYWVLLITSILTILVKTTSSVLLARQMGVAGIAFGTGIMYFVNFAFLYWSLTYISDQGYKN